jgi:hypothetical protein
VAAQEGLHEVSRRLLSVLLREMEGFDAEQKRTVVRWANATQH